MADEDRTPAIPVCSGLLVRDALREGAARLSAAGIEAPGREARLLLAHLLGTDLAGLLRDPAMAVPAAAWRALLDRRAGREPLALITGRQGFWTLDLAVSAATLIPRADSEAVVEAALSCLPDRAAPCRVLDLGTGTGCLLLAVLAERPAAFGIGIDRSAAAALLARGNAAANRLGGRAAFAVGDWTAAVAGRFDLILCNPPYIPRADLAGLMSEVRRHEPASALDGGADGLDAYRALLPTLSDRLADRGHAVLELGRGQAAAVPAMAVAAGLEPVGLRPDLGGIPRALILANKSVGTVRGAG